MLIGIAGKKQSGKDTVARLLKDELPQLEIKAFADSLKDICSLATNTPIELWYSGDKERVGVWVDEITVKRLRDLMNLRPCRRVSEILHEMLESINYSHCWRSCREFLQMVGDLGRASYPDYWINQTITQGLILSDARYKNERDAIRENGGILIQVNRDTVMQDAHSSENDLTDKYDYIIDNNGSLDELRKKVSEISKDIQARAYSRGIVN